MAGRPRACNELQSKEAKAPYWAVGVVSFALSVCPMVTRGQAYHRVEPTSSEHKALVSVRALQTPVKAQDAFRHGAECFRKGDAAGSLRYFDRAIHEFPDYYEAYTYKGAAEFLLNRRDEALQSFQKAIDLSGGHYARAYFGYGVLLLKQGKPEDAERLVRRGLAEDPNIADGHVVLSMILFNEGRFDEAEKSAGEAVRMPDSTGWRAFLVLASVHLRRAEYTSAVTDLERYLQAARNNPSCGADIESIQRILAEIKRSMKQAPD